MKKVTNGAGVRRDSRSRRSGRRSLLTGMAGALGATVFSGKVATGTVTDDDTPRPRAPDDPTKMQGLVPRELGERSPFERPRRLLMNRDEFSSGSRTPIHQLSGTITPADLHFERHHAGIPNVDPESYRLLIHGMVDRPMVFTLDELKRFPAVSRYHFLECSGNGTQAFRDQRRDMSPQFMDGLTSTSDWTGVPLKILFREVGVRQSASWFLAEGQDAAVMTRSIPLAKAWDDAMIVYAQNGEPIRPEQGYPARLFLPGFEGNSNIKWLRRLELADRPFMTREETSKYTDPLPGEKSRMFSLVMDAKSIITSPAYPMKLTDAGFWEIRGIAWTGRGRISRVELSTDGGQSWEDAELQDPILPKCHTRFRKLWRWDGGEHVLMSRATDETGYVQPTLEALKKVRGEGTRYHMNNIRAWRVEADGRVFYDV